MTNDFSLHSPWVFDHCFRIAHLSPLEAWFPPREALYQGLRSPVCDHSNTPCDSTYNPASRRAGLDLVWRRYWWL